MGSQTYERNLSWFLHYSILNLLIILTNKYSCHSLSKTSLYNRQSPAENPETVYKASDPRKTRPHRQICVTVSVSYGSRSMAEEVWKDEKPNTRKSDVKQFLLEVFTQTSLACWQEQCRPRGTSIKAVCSYSSCLCSCLSSHHGIDH